ncbi:MAG TPA: SlyX family protein [Rhodanobacteraceae bacterium]|jgi:SlyX protein|nr:SlyX family protein [Rhodanobacteraceae bacterium]
MPTPPDNERMNELELKLTFLDDAVASLNDSEAQQSQRLLRLEHALAELRLDLSALRTSLADDVHDEPPPPHY